jgi:hypothetical protein
MESKCSWEIFVENSHSSLCVITLEPFFPWCINFIKFNQEIKIWFPLLIIDNWDFNLFFSIGHRHGNSIVNVFVIVSWDSSVFYCSNTKSNALINCSLHNCDNSVSSTFSYGIMEAFETNIFIQIFNFLGWLVFDLTFDCSFNS